MRKINVYCGETVENRGQMELHPITQFNKAKEYVEFAMVGYENETPMSLFSNSPDFISAMFYIANDNNMNIEFFLNDVSCGNDIELIFNDLNRFYDLLDNYVKE